MQEEHFKNTLEGEETMESLPEELTKGRKMRRTSVDEDDIVDQPHPGSEERQEARADHSIKDEDNENI